MNLDLEADEAYPDGAFSGRIQTPCSSTFGSVHASLNP